MKNNIIIAETFIFQYSIILIYIKILNGGNIMGKQYNKAEKKARRERQIKQRKKRVSEMKKTGRAGESQP